MFFTKKIKNKTCDHWDVLLDEMLKHVKDEAIEIQLMDKIMEVGIYTTYHNENGDHDITRFNVAINYCPICGKRMRALLVKYD